MKPIIISPPFGNYITSPLATSVRGSHTRLHRPGLTRATLQFFLDNYQHPVDGGYRNRIGLRNKGIERVSLPVDDICSLAGIDDGDWEAMFEGLDSKRRIRESQHPWKAHLELNLRCTNVHGDMIKLATLKEYCKYYTITAKLPPDDDIFSIAELCAEAGVNYLHCSNTLLSDLGGLSGYPLKLRNLPLVERLAAIYTRIPIIGGGGIYCWQDLLDYWNAGATYFSTSTIWFHPWRAQALLQHYYNQ